MSPAALPQPYWSDETVTLHLGDCLDVLRTLPVESVDAIVTDPPAGVSFMGREWDSNRGSRGMWVAWLAERLEAAARVLKPGGHLLVWSLPRTSHWTAWAVEDAGLEIRDCVLHLFGSGFPKSLDVSKAIDKRPGVGRHAEFTAHLAERREAAGLSRADVSERVVGTRTGACWNWEHHQWPEARWWPALRDLLGLDAKWGPVIAEAERTVVGERTTGIGSGRGSVPVIGDTNNRDITAPATDDATRWEGWGTALKPGQEMWWLARKPLKGTVAASVLEYGTGALNIKACMVAHASDADLAASLAKNPGRDDTVTSGTYGADRPQQSVNVAGRWPTNIVFTHSAACEPIGLREVRSDGHHPASRGAGGLGTSGHAGQDGLAERRSGSERVEAWSCAPDCPAGELDRQSGASVSRSGGLSTKALGVMNDDAWQARDVPRIGHDDRGGASRFYPTFRYQAKAPSSERPRLDDGTAHETVKSLGLMRWMVRLITPPDGTVLDMFAGSGPVGEACIVEGFSCVLIEQDPKSAELIKARLSKPIQPVMFGLEAS